MPTETATTASTLYSPARTEETWLRFLSRWSIASVAVTLGLLVTFVVGVGFDPTVPQEYGELVQASRHPEAYRAAMSFDGLDWLMIAGAFLALGAFFYRRAPVRSLLIAACGFGMTSGSLGGYLRLNATSELAARYAVATAQQQTTLVQTYLVLEQVIASHFQLGQLLQTAGYLLIASIALSLVRFPRWLAIWLAVPGITSGILFAFDTVGVFLFPLLFVHIFVVIGLNVAIAWTFWRGNAELSVR